MRPEYENYSETASYEVWKEASVKSLQWARGARLAALKRKKRNAVIASMMLLVMLLILAAFVLLVTGVLHP